jgi:mono/diheme cytochrome c family protein
MERTMKRLAVGVLVTTLVLVVAAFSRSGGWAVVSVANVPDAWVAGEPLELSWTVRQHGNAHIPGLEPELEARSGSRRVSGTIAGASRDGRAGYRGTITFPEPGDWQVTVRSGFGRSRAVLVPWRVVNLASRPGGSVDARLAASGVQPLGSVERGRRLFAAKGCVTCHVHRAVGITGEVANVGPDLTDRRFSDDYLKRFLADPSIKPPSNGERMPNPGLQDQDIAQLVAFINAGRARASR